MRKFLLWIFLFSFFYSSAQDTLTVLQYNLLNYGNYTSYCTPTNNNYHDKDGYIRTIVNYVNPDIFTVCEMSSSTDMQQHLLNAALDTLGVTKYKMANFISQNTSSDLVNMLYYNSEKLGLAGHTIAQNYIRDVDIYKLYFKSDNLSQGDTIFLYCVVAHLKASSGSTYEAMRATMASNTMSYLENHKPDNNYLLMGDFNIYSSSEAAFQDFINYSDPIIRFYDPINEIGDWHSNPAYAAFHTQSTHTTSSGCASTGGMDDRFDFIMISSNIKNDNKRVHYIPGTYQAVGQDGKHFNLSLLDAPADKIVPPDVLNALYNNSDHLPVTMKLQVDEPLGTNSETTVDFDIFHFVNPVNNTFIFTVNSEKALPLKVEIFSILGQRALMKQFYPAKGFSKFTMDVSGLPRGLYIVRFTDENRHLSFTRKLLKN
ncbi:MAG: T9SS type A sorting domain-containing protein [Bacteroidales bacterium]|nr:T9SS type A sorting domain-containing protein [Bacteroidales bacterium]